MLRPLNKTIIADYKINKIFEEDYFFFYLSTKDLCAGKYELWYVVRSRVGSVI